MNPFTQWRWPLLVRVISAVLAGLLLLGAGYFGGSNGLCAISTIAIVLGIREFRRIAFVRLNVPPRFLDIFTVACGALYMACFLSPAHGVLWLPLAFAFFLTFALWLTRNRISNEDLLAAIAMAAFGMLYCISLPIYAVHIAYLPHGPMWFLYLMLVVFAGDTFAFFGGRFFGARKLMPQISPNKTIEGALSGILGSCLSGVILIFVVFPETPIWRALVFSALCGFVGQAGDLIMSLVKRVAQVKDSGSIMPGHGGVLDRLDGIFLAAPLVYAFAIS